MIESINITYFFIFSSLLFLYLLLFSIIKISGKAEELYNKIKSGVNTLISKNKQAEEAVKLFYSKFLPALNKIFSIAIKNLYSLSLYINKFEIVLKSKGGYSPSDAVNYSALALRKLYDGNAQLWLVYSSLVIVVFYFILTVF